jgi:hypothetical protein
LPISSFFAKKSPSGASSALTSVAVVVKPWFEAEKMLFFYEINNFSETGIFLNQTHHPLFCY